MTIKRLNRYAYLEPKIRRLNRELDALNQRQLCGAVQTSNGPGGTQREEVLRGVPDGQAEKAAELEACLLERDRIRIFIYEVPDERIKEIMTRRYLYKERWAVARRLKAHGKPSLGIWKNKFYFCPFCPQCPFSAVYN